jgi:GTPase SAR1 family protein
VLGYEIIRKFHRLKVLDLDLVALLDLPNELQGRELQIILSYLRELALASSTINDLNEDTSTLLMKRIKIIVIGPGEAGKTTLLHRLTHGKFEGGYGMTDGINMTDLVLDDLRISLWDFSGQNIYLNTHLLFYAPVEVLYLLTWNPRQQEQHQAVVSVYLNMIRNYSPSAPVILVTTHAKDTSRVTDYTLQNIERQFSGGGTGTGTGTGTATTSGHSQSSFFSSSSSQPSHPPYGPICCYHHVDSQTGIGIQELKKDILKYSLQQPWVVQRVPKIFKKLEVGLKELANHGRFSLTRNEYLKYCYEVYKIDEESSLHALNLFHTWGIVHVLSLGDIIIEPQKLALV